MRVLGCAYHSPDFVTVSIVKKKKYKASDILFVGPGVDLPAKTNKTVFIFLRKMSLRRNLDRVNSNKYKGKLGIVFDSPLALFDFVGLVPADFVESPDFHLDAFELHSLNLDLVKGEDTPVTYCKQNYEEVVQAKVESFTGILTQFMTFVYTTPRATHQKHIKELACSWWSSDQTVPMLESRLEETAKGSPLSDKQKKRFMDLTTSESALTYKKALAVVKKLPSNDCEEFTQAASDFGVSAYELRYILAIASVTK